MKIEPITPIINRTPKRWKPSKENPLVVEVLEYEEFQNGWNFGEGGMVGKLNEIIEHINSKDDITLTKQEIK